MAAMFVGCQNDPAGIKEALNEPEFKATFDTEDTRVYLGEDNYYRWEAGDKVSVFAFDDRNRMYEAEDSDVILTDLNFVSKPDAPTGSPTPSVWDRHYAVFPYSTANHLAFVNGAFYSIVAQLAAEQVHDASKAGLDYAIMTSTIPSMDKVFHFKNSCALIKVNVRTTADWADEFYLNSIKVESKNNYLAGRVVVDAGNDDFTAKVVEDNNATKSITLSGCEEVGKMTPEYKTFIIAIPAGTYAADDLTLSFDCSNDAFDCNVTVPTGYEVARSKYMEFNVTLDLKFDGTFDWYETIEEESKTTIILKSSMVLRKAIIADVENLNTQAFPYQSSFDYIFDVPARDVTELVIDGWELENVAGVDLENIDGNIIEFKPVDRGEGEFPAYVINTFTTLSSGIKGVTPAKVTVKDLIIAGKLRTTTMGIYVNGTAAGAVGYPTGAVDGEVADQAAFDTEWNFVKMYGLEIIPYLGRGSNGVADGLGAAVICYGKAVLNNCYITGTVASDDVATREDLIGIPIYDLASPNNSYVYLNDSEVGSIYAWEQADYTMNGATVNWMNWRSINYGSLNKWLRLTNGSTMNVLFVNTYGSYEPMLLVDESSKINTMVVKEGFDYAGAITKGSFSNVADGTIGKVIVDGTVADGVVSGGTEMTWDEFKATKLTAAE